MIVQSLCAAQNCQNLTYIQLWATNRTSVALLMFLQNPEWHSVKPDINLMRFTSV